MKNTKLLWIEKNRNSLIENKIDFIEIEPWHFQLYTKLGIVNFWTTTSKWHIQKNNEYGLGFNNLLEKIK